MAKIKKPRLGSGKRFQALANKFAKKGNIEDPAALASSIARKKYGNKKMTEMSEKGKSRHAHDMPEHKHH